MNSRILETILIDWSKLKDLQPEGIKTSENEQALRESLQKYGFVVPFYVWKDSKGILWTIDGHTRKKVLKDMQAPEMLQATLIQAKNKKEAQEMLIEVFNQRQNCFVIEVLEAYIQENELEVDIESVNVEVEEVESGGLYEEYEEAQFGTDFSLPDGDKAPFQQMTFTLADEQATHIKNAISDIKKTQEYKYSETMGNENSNGNALYLIIMQWAEQKR